MHHYLLAHFVLVFIVRKGIIFLCRRETDKGWGHKVLLKATQQSQDLAFLGLSGLQE